MHLSRLRFYDLSRHWTKRVEPHLDDPRLNEYLNHDFALYVERWMRRFFRPGQFPREFERFERHNHLPYQRREPRYWRYVKWSSCHYMANFQLRLAMLAEPDRPWRIITNSYHTTVWDGENTTFEFTYLALDCPVDTIWTGELDIYSMQPGVFGRVNKENGLCRYLNRKKFSLIIPAAQARLSA
jgi:hypothetical protein